ncbi:9257_t:CDS:1, partial [Acaulospora colombiana]
MPKRPGSPIKSNVPTKVTRFSQSKSSVKEQCVQGSTASRSTSAESQPVTAIDKGKGKDVEGSITSAEEVTNEMSTMELSEGDKIEKLPLNPRGTGRIGTMKSTEESPSSDVMR